MEALQSIAIAFITALCRPLQQTNQWIQSSISQQYSIRNKRKHGESEYLQEQDCVFGYPRNKINVEPQNWSQVVNPGCECEKFIRIDSEKDYTRETGYQCCCEERIIINCDKQRGEYCKFEERKFSESKYSEEFEFGELNREFYGGYHGGCSFLHA